MNSRVFVDIDSWGLEPTSMVMCIYIYYKYYIYYSILYVLYYIYIIYIIYTYYITVNIYLLYYIIFNIFYIYIYIYISWLVVSTPLKNMKVSWGYEIPNLWKKKIHVPHHQPVIYCWGKPSWAIAKSIGCCWPADFLFRIVRPHFGSPWRCGFSTHILSLPLIFCKVIAPTKKSFISDLPGFDGFIIRSPLFVWNGVCPQHPVFALKPMGLNPFSNKLIAGPYLGVILKGINMDMTLKLV